MTIRISSAATRPPPFCFSRVWEITPLQRFGEHHADLRLPVGRELVDDPVHGGAGRRRVQRAEDQVAGLGGLDGDGDRLQVPHLADEHDVRVLAQRGAQGLLEAVGVGADLALVDQALLVLVDELDRVLDGDDVVGTVSD